MSKQYTSETVAGEELYGELMQVTSLTIQGKNEQYLTNELFKAAKADLKIDKNNGNRGDQVRGELDKNSAPYVYGTTQNLDIFIDNLAEKMKAENEKRIEKFKKKKEISERKQSISDPSTWIPYDHREKSEIAAKLTQAEEIKTKLDAPEQLAAFKSELKASLLNDYKELKHELAKTRVRGVGKNTKQKLFTICANIVRLPAALLKGIFLTVGLANDEINNPARVATKTGELRGSLKDTLRKALTNHSHTKSIEDMDKNHGGLKPVMQYNNIKSSIKTAKLWKKQKPEQTR